MKIRGRVYVIAVLACASSIFLTYKFLTSPVNKDTKRQSVKFTPAGTEQTATTIKPKKVILSETEIVNKVNKYLENSENHADFVRNQHMRMARIQFNAVLARLSLSREDEEALMVLLAEKSATSLAIRNVATRNEQHTKSISEQAERTLRGEMLQDLDIEISSLLGAEKYSIFQDFKQKVPFYYFSNSLADSLAHTSEPITQEQINKMTDFISEYAQPDEIRTSYFYNIILSAPDDIITPRQKARITQLQKEENEIRRLKAELNEKK